MNARGLLSSAARAIQRYRESMRKLDWLRASLIVVGLPLACQPPKPPPAALPSRDGGRAPMEAAGGGEAQGDGAPVDGRQLRDAAPVEAVGADVSTVPGGGACGVQTIKLPFLARTSDVIIAFDQ